MKYEKPEIVELSPAIDAIQTSKDPGAGDNLDSSPAYQDWE